MNHDREPEHVLITGASGFVGSALRDYLHKHGFHTHCLVRSMKQAPADAILWNPETGSFDFHQPIHAVIHLAGESIVSGRWTGERKKKILDSRERTTRALSAFLAQRPQRPGLYLVASATGFYGDRGSTLLSEHDSSGTGFLAEVCSAWESATQPARAAGIPTASLRFGVVLGRAGGALQKMLLPFRLCLGGRIGSGKQYMSWIAIQDVVRAVHFLLLDAQRVSGSVNVVSPQPLTNQEFTAALGKALHRPTPFPVPASLLRLVFGELADEALLASQRVYPQRLLELGFEFQLPEIAEALKYITHDNPEHTS